MPNNCSTLIQRKQNILHKILRSNSEGKLQNAIAETTSELRVAGTGKIAAYSTSANHLTAAAAANAPVINRRTNLFNANRVQPSNGQPNYERHLPSIRDAAGPIERQQPQYQQSYDDLQSRSRVKTPVTTASPKNTARPPSATFSSLYNTLAKRSNENFISSTGDFDESIKPASRQSRRASNDSNKYGIPMTNPTPMKSITVLPKYSADSGVDSRHSASPPDVNQLARSNLPIRFRANVQTETVAVHEVITATATPTKERTHNGQLYQRRTNNNNMKTSTKQKIDKYRRRSEEVTQAMNGNGLLNSVNTGLSATTPALTNLKPPPPPPAPAPVRRVTSDGEIQARLEVLRLSMDTNVMQADKQQPSPPPPPPPPPTQQHPNSRHRLKSPYLYATHQQLAPTNTPHVPSAVRRTQAPGATTQTVHRNSNSNGVTHRRQYQHIPQQQQQHHTIHPNAGNLYFAFIASRHVSANEDPPYDYDIDHSKLIRIFTWLKNVEEHRHELLDHDKLLIEQTKRMKDQEDNLSLYSELQYAVDDLPPNTSGKPCEKIAPMNFED